MAVKNFFDSISVSATGLSAERIRMNVIANNIANMHTTRSKENGGGPYLRQIVLFEEVLGRALGKGGPGMGGVRVADILRDSGAVQWIDDPSHPHAVKEGKNKGMVLMPDINPVFEMVNMITAQRAYEANVQAIAAARSIITKSLEIGR